MEMKNIGQLLKWGKSELSGAHLRTPALDAEVLLMEALGVERLVIHVYPEREVLPKEIETYQSWIRRRKTNEPLQYITGTKEFMGLDFHVEKGVLIPRGDTEVVVEAAIKLLTEIGEKREFRAEDLRLTEKTQDMKTVRALDIGVGSGAIAVSLLYYLQNLFLIGTDISPTALKVTESNAKTHGVLNRLELYQGSLFEPLDRNIDPKGRIFDLIISNPPYISYDVRETLDREVKDYEPGEALFAKEQGLFYYREIAQGAPSYLKKNGILVFEIGYDQGEAVRRILQKSGYSGVQVLKDLENRDRVVIGKR